MAEFIPTNRSNVKTPAITELTQMAMLFLLIVSGNSAKNTPLCHEFEINSSRPVFFNIFRKSNMGLSESCPASSLIFSGSISVRFKMARKL